MSFDLLAPHYRWMEWILAGRKLQRCRTAFLSVINEPRNALLLGEGNGRFLEAFVTKFPHCHVTYLDASRKMLELARARLREKTSNVEFVHADIRDWSPAAQPFDLVVSHFFLDCFRPEQLEQIVGRIAASTTTNARWLIADFRQPQEGWRKWRAKWILCSMYLFFRWATALPAAGLTPPDRFLQRSGFVLTEQRLFDWGLLHTDLWLRQK